MRALLNKLSLKADPDLERVLGLEQEQEQELAPVLELELEPAPVVVAAAVLLCMTSAAGQASQALLAAPQEHARRRIVTIRNVCDHVQGGIVLECV